MLRDQILVQVPGIVLDCGQTSGLVWSVSGPRSSYSESSKNEYFVHSRTVTLFYIQALHILVVFFHRGSVNSSLIINDKGCLYSCPTLTWIPVLKWGPPTWLWLLSAPQSCYVLLRVLFYHTYTNTGTTHSEWERHTTVHSLQKAHSLIERILSHARDQTEWTKLTCQGRHFSPPVYGDWVTWQAYFTWQRDMGFVAFHCEDTVV